MTIEGKKKTSPQEFGSNRWKFGLVNSLMKRLRATSSPDPLSIKSRPSPSNFHPQHPRAKARTLQPVQRGPADICGERTINQDFHRARQTELRCVRTYLYVVYPSPRNTVRFPCNLHFTRFRLKKKKISWTVTWKSN